MRTTTKNVKASCLFCWDVARKSQCTRLLGKLIYFPETETETETASGDPQIRQYTLQMMDRVEAMLPQTTQNAMQEKNRSSWS